MEKRIVEIKHQVCPFCECGIDLTVEDIKTDEETGEMSGRYMDSWTCKTCGSDNAVASDEFTEDSLYSKNYPHEDDPVKEYTIAQNCVARMQFQPALNHLKNAFSYDPNYFECQHLLKKVEKMILLKQ